MSTTNCGRLNEIDQPLEKTTTFTYDSASAIG